MSAPAKNQNKRHKWALDNPNRYVDALYGIFIYVKSYELQLSYISWHQHDCVVSVVVVNVRERWGHR